MSFFACDYQETGCESHLLGCCFLLKCQRIQKKNWYFEIGKSLNKDDN